MDDRKRNHPGQESGRYDFQPAAPVPHERISVSRVGDISPSKDLQGIHLSRKCVGNRGKKEHSCKRAIWKVRKEIKKRKIGWRIFPIIRNSLIIVLD